MNIDKLHLKVINKNTDHKYQQLRNYLREFNISQIGTYSKNEPLFLGLYDSEDKLVAGLYAYLSLGMFYIDLLWVSQSLRNQGIGSKLLIKAEEYAINKKALYIRVNTATFQALDFYLKNGFEVLTKLPLLIDNQTDQFDYYLVKFLK